MNAELMVASFSLIKYKLLILFELSQHPYSSLSSSTLIGDYLLALENPAFVKKKKKIIFSTLMD